MNDIVEVEGFIGQLPLLTFIQKGVGITDLQGEKLSEHQVLRSVALFEKRTQIKSAFYIVIADADAKQYRLYYEVLRVRRRGCRRA